MNLRRATAADAAALARMRWLHLQSDEETYGSISLQEAEREAFLRENQEFWERENGYAAFVAEEAGEIVSTIYLYLIQWPPMPGGETVKIGYLSNVHTKKEWRGQGIAAKLMGYVKEYALSQGCVRLFVWPSPLAQSWYEKNGFGTKKPILEWNQEEEAKR